MTLVSSEFCAEERILYCGDIVDDLIASGTVFR